jgi:ketosteroid isomerase-like protein
MGTQEGDGQPAGTDRPAIMKAFLAAFNAHDVDAVMEFFTDDCEPIEVRGCDLFAFEGDKIRRKDSFWKIVE